MDDLRNFLAQQGAYGYGAPAPQQAPQQAPMSAADRYAPGLMSPAPSMGSRPAPGMLGPMQGWGGFGGGGIPGSGRGINPFTGLPRQTVRDPGFYDPATGMGGPRNADGSPLTGGGGGVNQMAPGYDPQMGLQKALQGLLGGSGPSSSGVSLGSLAGGGYPGLGPSRARY